MTALLLCWLPVGSAAPPEPVERTLVYWMAYDNNLSPLAEPIVEMIAAGVESPQVVVTVHIDRRGPGGMERVVITDAGIASEPLPHQEGSADLAMLTRELDWVREHHPAHRYGVVFLDHGGRLDEMSRDEHGGSRWLDPRHVAHALSRWDEETAGDVDLVFVQQCGKASVETLHALAPVADVVVASEAVIGAPNFYYPVALKGLSADPTQDGVTLATALVSHDRPDMYRTYTVASGPALLALPERLDPALAPLLALGADLRWTGGPEPVFDTRGERYPDLLGLLTLLYADNGLDTEPLATFRSWWDQEVMLTHQVSPRHPRDARRLSGATVLMPNEPGDWRAYADFPLYQETDLHLLMDQLVR